MKDKKRLEVKLSVRGDGSLSRNNLRSSNRSNRSNTSNNSSGLPVSEIFATDRFSAPYNRSFDILDKYRRQPNQYGYPAQSLQALNHYEQSGNNGYGTRERSNPYIDYTDTTKPYYQSQQLHNEGQYRYQPVYNDSSIHHGSLPRSVSRLDQQKGNPVYEDDSFRSTLPRSVSRQDQRVDNQIYVDNSFPRHGSLPRSISRIDHQRNNPVYNEEHFRPSGSMPRQTRFDDQRNPAYDPSVRLHGTLPRSVSRHDQQNGTPIYPNTNYTLPAKYGPRRVRISELEPIVHGYGKCKLGCQFPRLHKTYTH